MKKRKAKRRKREIDAGVAATLTIGRQKLTGLFIQSIDCTAEQVMTGLNISGGYHIYPTGRYRVVLTLLGENKP